MTLTLTPDLSAVVAEQPDPLLFATVSGAHLYGFPSRDSDVDLRGAHLLPVDALIGLREPEETRSRMWDRDGVEMDLVTHDLRKFARLMLRRNGYVLEQLTSPLVAGTDGDPRGARLAGAAAAHPSSCPPLPRLRRDAVAALREQRRAQAAALHLPGAAHGHPPDALRRGAGPSADPGGGGGRGSSPAARAPSRRRRPPSTGGPMWTPRPYGPRRRPCTASWTMPRRPRGSRSRCTSTTRCTTSSYQGPAEHVEG
ncbi:hypothetical protein STANM309S_03027 [Streptomyces tanashiensis]